MNSIQSRSKFGWLSLALGVLMVALGFYTLMNPSVLVSGLVALYSAAAVVTGVADIVLYFRLRDAGDSIVPLVTGMVSVLAGAMLLLNPILGRWLISMGFSIWFIAHSVSRIAGYKTLRCIEGRAMAALSALLNALGALLGLVLFFNPSLSLRSFSYLSALALIALGAGCLFESFTGLGQKTGGQPSITSAPRAAPEGEDAALQSDAKTDESWCL